MNRDIKRRVMALGLVLILGSVFLSNKDQNFLHAQDNRGVVAYTGDPSYTSDPLPDDTQLITLSFKDIDNKPLTSIKVYIDGEEYKYNAADFVNGVLTLAVSKNDKQLIEFYKNEAHFEPAYLLLNEKTSDVKDNYDVLALAGSEKKIVEINAKDAQGNKKTEFKDDESAYISFNINRPMTTVFYSIQDGEKHIYDKPFKIDSDIKSMGSVKISYSEVRYYPKDTPPTLDYDFSSLAWVSYSITFHSTTTPDPSPTTPTFKDKDGNIFLEKDVKLNVSTLKNMDSYKDAIASFPEFKAIPSSQISYLDISVLAGTIKVQPVNKYNFVIPYPANSTKDHEFVVYHFKNDDVKQSEQLQYEAKTDGLHVSVDSFSPFVVGWKEKAVTPPKTDNSGGTTITDNINTGDSSASQISVFIIFLATSMLLVQGIKLYRKSCEE